MREAATKESRRILPLPERRIPLKINATYTGSDIDSIKLGLIPETMEEKWFIYLNEDWLYFHRSWTGACIFGVKFRIEASDCTVLESWANRDKDQYNSDDADYDKKLVLFLIDALLLKKSVEFPRPAELPEVPPGIYQHHVVGQAHPEIRIPKSPQSNGIWKRIIYWLKGNSKHKEK